MADPRYSINILPGNGVQTTWEISFAGGYISREHVKAYVRVGLLDPVDIVFEWVSDNTIRVVPAVPEGATLVVYRDTPKDKPLADFVNGAIVTEDNLDVNAKQAVFIAAEAQDNGSERIDALDTQAVRSLAGGLVVGPGFVVVGSDGKASAQDFVNVIKTLTDVADDGAWGGAFVADDGVFG